MKSTEKIVLTSLLVLLIVALGAILATHDWADSPRRLHVDMVHAVRKDRLVDTRALETAQQLAPLAVTHWEQEYAQEALRLADRSVDLAFASALADAKDNPPAETPATREMKDRLQALETRVAAETAQVAQLTAKLAKAPENQKEAVKGNLDLISAQLALDQDEVEDTHQDLTRAGGDTQALIQQELDQHNASESHTGKAGQADASSWAEASTSKALVTRVKAIWSLHTKISLLDQARQNALDRAGTDSRAHEALEKDLNQEKAQKKIVRARTKTHAKADEAGGGAAAAAAAAQAASEGGPVNAQGAAISQLDFLQHLGVDQRDLASYDRRIQDEQSLAAVYGNWATLARARRNAGLHAVFVSLMWIIVIGLCIFVANFWVQKFVADLTIDRRQLQAIRAVILFAVQVIGIVLILLVIFGVPDNFATVAALAGAGITVAMKDFIVGFFGWFILMGPDGVKPGDWVEINGVGGEVLSVGLLRTVILETGSWLDAGHPTGRKVTFVNSFAIDGHYFNFSTSGQWMWDEIQVQVPADKDPYRVAEDIQKVAADETVENGKLAEEEWQKVTTGDSKKSFSATPSMSVRPTGSGVDVRVRYLTRANERHEVRAKLYRAVLDLLNSAKGREGAAPNPAT
ncbi:MAG TPA: mechanosensitive ion channel domain-containing protein [Candidatus Acidoferrales bacterium]